MCSYSAISHTWNSMWDSDREEFRILSLGHFTLCRHVFALELVLWGLEQGHLCRGQRNNIKLSLRQWQDPAREDYWVQECSSWNSIHLHSHVRFCWWGILEFFVGSAEQILKISHKTKKGSWLQNKKEDDQIRTNYQTLLFQQVLMSFS